MEWNSCERELEFFVRYDDIERTTYDVLNQLNNNQIFNDIIEVDAHTGARTTICVVLVRVPITIWLNYFYWNVNFDCRMPLCLNKNEWYWVRSAHAYFLEKNYLLNINSENLTLFSPINTRADDDINQRQRKIYFKNAKRYTVTVKHIAQVVEKQVDLLLGNFS